MRRSTSHLLCPLFFLIQLSLFSLNPSLLPTLHAASLPPDPLPPGVALAEIPPPPQGYAAQALSIDWTDPRLHSNLVDARQPGRPAPEIATLEQPDPDPLRIQLSEPVNATDPDPDLALPIFGIPPSTSFSTFSSNSFIALSRNASWLPLINSSDSPLAVYADRVATRWLDRADALDQLPSLDFEYAALLSITQPATALTRFIVVNRTSPGPGRLGELRRWLDELSSPEDLIALHSVGAHAFVSFRGWRLGQPPDPRRPQRAGALLELRAAKTGDPVDWLRQPGVRLRASDSETGFPESAPIGNPLIPNLLSPRAWVTLPRQPASPPHFFLATFQTSRLLHRIDLAFAESAGWSPHFNPARVTLEIAREAQESPRPIHEFQDPGPFATWTPSSPIRIRAIRLVFDEPSGIPTDTRARLAALSAWGLLE